jgi:hypothetical protein
VGRGLLLPLGLGDDFQVLEVHWSGHYLVNPWDQHGLIDLTAYPKTAAFFAPHTAALQARHTARERPDKWFKTIDRVTLSLVGERKLYVADIRGRLEPALDEGRTYPHHNIYWITSRTWDLRVLGALLMSDIGEFFVRCYGVRMRGGYFRFQAQYLRRIRVPHPGNIPDGIAKKLVQAYEEFDRRKATALAYGLYGIETLPQ